MRKVFHQYFRPSSDELNELWQQGLLSFDASVLLNVYGYSRKTRDNLVEFIEMRSDRVRLPHQFGLEFARNRSSVIVKQVHNYLRVEEELRKIRDTYLEPKRDHPYLTKKSSRAYQAIMNELEESRKVMEKLVSSDPYADRMFTIFDGRVGKCPTPEELLEMEAEAQRRFDKTIPPGYADVKEKGVPQACGDYIGWRQLMEIAKLENKGVILVTDDVKEDWWLLERGRTLGPRPELLEEFSRVTGQRFYMYNSDNFLRAAKEFTSIEIREDVLEEVSERLASALQGMNAALLKTVPISQGIDAQIDALLSDKATGLKQAAPIADAAPSSEKAGPKIDRGEEV